MTDKTKENLRKLLLVSSYCETLGFNNGTWEFNTLGPKQHFVTNPVEAFFVSSIIVEEYVFLGGSKIDISKWKSSDDTILLMATTKALTHSNYREELMNKYELLNQGFRFSGINTLEILQDYIKNPDTQIMQYKSGAGGNGAAIRTAPIGLAFPTIKDIIIQSFVNSIQTHNQILGYMGGIVVALMTRFASEKINPFKWFDKLLEINDKEIIDNILTNGKIGYRESDGEIYIKKKYTFWDKIKDYNDYRLKKLEKNTFELPVSRYEFLFRFLRLKYDNNKNIFLGASGLEAVILSYDAILLSYDKSKDKIDFDKLIYYGVLHSGDNDSTGAIVGAIYAAYNKEIPKSIENKVNKLEFYKEINKIIDNLP